MKRNITYKELEAIANDISEQAETSPAFSLFNSEKISRFFDKNKHRLRVVSDKRKALIQQYVLHEKGQPVIVEKEGKQVYDFATEQMRQAYLDDFNKFMEVSFDLIF